MIKRSNQVVCKKCHRFMNMTKWENCMDCRKRVCIKCGTITACETKYCRKCIITKKSRNARVSDQWITYTC